MIYLAIYLIGVVAAFLLIALINDAPGDEKNNIPAIVAFFSVLFLILCFIGVFSEYKPSFKQLFKRKKQ